MDTWGSNSSFLIFPEELGELKLAATDYEASTRKQTVGACRCSTIKIHIQLILSDDAVVRMHLLYTYIYAYVMR